MICAASLLAIVVYSALVGVALGNGERFVNSHFLFWGWARFIHVVTPSSRIYDPRALMRFERGLPGAHPENLPFAYPPTLLLVIWPLGLIPAVPGWLAWIALSVGAFVWATWHCPAPYRASDLTYGRGVLVALILPSTLAAVYYAETSLFIAALMIGGCRLLDRRPVLAGVLFGLAAIKPQFGVLIPLALLAAHKWSSIVAACATVLAAGLASGMVFGWACWADLPHALAHVSRLVADQAQVSGFSPTIAAGLRQLSAPPPVVDGGQALVTVAAAAVVWMTFRYRGGTIATASLLVCALLATPYAFFYDLPLASYAALALLQERKRPEDPFAPAEGIVLMLTLALPLLILFNPLHVPWGAIVLPLLLGLIVHKAKLLPIRRNSGATRSLSTSG